MVSTNGEGDAGGGDPMCVDECEGAGPPQDGGPVAGDDGAREEVQGAVCMSCTKTRMRVEEAETEEAATVQGSKEGAEELLLKDQKSVV